MNNRDVKKATTPKMGPKNPKGYKASLPVAVTPEMKAEVELEAVLQGISSGEIVRRALVDYLAAQKTKRNENRVHLGLV